MNGLSSLIILSFSFFSDDEKLECIRGIAAQLVQQLSLRGAGGDLIRQALAILIHHCSQAAFPVHARPDVLDLWQAVLGEYRVLLVDLESPTSLTLFPTWCGGANLI